MSRNTHGNKTGKELRKIGGQPVVCLIQFLQ